MAVIKAVSSRAGIKTILNYVMKEEKTEQKLLSCLNCTPDMVQEQMEFTKRLWGKNGGRTYKHFVQSFAPEENIDPVQAHQIACQLAASRPEWQDFEVLIATHEDKKHIHTHFVVNSVSCVDGHKIQQSKAELQAMKDILTSCVRNMGCISPKRERPLTDRSERKRQRSARTPISCSKRPSRAR